MVCPIIIKFLVLLSFGAIYVTVIRVHKLIRRKGKSWHAGQKVKVLKGACSGVHKNNIYAVLEYILLDGFQGDAGGKFS